MTTTERWPPVYDADGLARQIRDLAERDGLTSAFYLSPAGPAPQDRCQGDVIAFRSPVPLIDADGEVVGVGEVEHWLLISNSCDLDRSLDEVTWAQLVPIDVLGAVQLQPGQRAALQGYQTSRRFFVPAWADDDVVRVADFTRPVTIHRDALSGATVAARMSQIGWMLLHSCLVRFLARDDGRHDG